MGLPILVLSGGVPAGPLAGLHLVAIRIVIDFRLIAETDLENATSEVLLEDSLFDVSQELMSQRREDTVCIPSCW